MSEQHTLLTTYFGERDRVGGRLLADVLLDLYETERVDASVLLRGAEGFGAAHALRTEDLLSLSEDLPLLAVAVDRHERIEALREPVGGLLAQRGLLTTAPVRMLAVDGGTGLDGEVALTIELGRGARVGHTPAHVAVCELLHREGIAGATVLVGVDGTRRGQRTRARVFAANAAVPVTITAVGDGERIERALGQLRELVGDAPVTAAPVQVCKRDGERLARPGPPAAGGGPPRQRLTAYTTQSALHDGAPISSAIVRRLRRGGTAGVTSLRGVWGFHGADPPHGDRLWQLRRHVPVVTTCVDTPERIAAAFDVVDELTAEHGLITCETVRR